jgi:hypothetical protein
VNWEADPLSCDICDICFEAITMPAISFPTTQGEVRVSTFTILPNGTFTKFYFVIVCFCAIRPCMFLFLKVKKQTFFLPKNTKWVQWPKAEQATWIFCFLCYQVNRQIRNWWRITVNWGNRLLPRWGQVCICLGPRGLPRSASMITMT